MSVYKYANYLIKFWEKELTHKQFIVVKNILDTKDAVDARAELDNIRIKQMKRLIAGGYSSKIISDYVSTLEDIIEHLDRYVRLTN